MVNFAQKARLLCAVALAFACQAASAFTHEITEAELQQKIALAMPYEIKKPLYTLMLSDPSIDLHNVDGNIKVITQAKLDMPSLKMANSLAGRVEFIGQLAYEPSSTSFYLKKVVIKRIDWDGVPENYQAGLQLVAQLTASKILSSKPVYVIKGDSMKARFAKSFLQSVAVNDGKLILTMEIF